MERPEQRTPGKSTSKNLKMERPEQEEDEAPHMAGAMEAKLQNENHSFVWDETTQLYFHASTGFYHDPIAGWYYSSRDGCYYKFENGSYVLLESNQSKVDKSEETQNCGRNVDLDNPVQDESSIYAYYNAREESNACECIMTTSDESIVEHIECSSSWAPDYPPPPSQWLEETLINLYLSGYNQEDAAAGGSSMSMEMDVNNDAHKLEGDCTTGDHAEIANLNESIIDEDALRDEENWQAQYGQVVHSGEESAPNSVDLWDWATVTSSEKDGKCQVVRLVGRLVKRSTKLHPSVASGGGLFRTAPICEVQLDLVRVRTGQVYKLHNPSARYLASVSIYDSSNPTKDWGFPELTVNLQDVPLTKSRGMAAPELVDEDTDSEGMPILPNQVSLSKKQKTIAYRDRAAERRTLHGGFGVGPGQKREGVGDVDSSSPVSTSTEEAAAEALNMSFGAGSYARKILESMGWKEGEALGSTAKGLIEPLQAVGNIGNAGLGWPKGSEKH